MTQSHTIRVINSAQNCVIIHQSGKIIFGSSAIKQFAQNKKYIKVKIDTETRQLTLAFYTRPRYDRQILYSAPLGKKFCFIGKSLAHLLPQKQVIPIGRFQTLNATPSETSFVANIKKKSAEG